MYVVKVLVDLVKRFGWTYIAGIYTNDNYGVEGFKVRCVSATLSNKPRLSVLVSVTVEWNRDILGKHYDNQHWLVNTKMFKDHWVSIIFQQMLIDNRDDYWTMIRWQPEVNGYESSVVKGCEVSLNRAGNAQRNLWWHLVVNCWEPKCSRIIIKSSDVCRCSSMSRW